MIDLALELSGRPSEQLPLRFHNTNASLPRTATGLAVSSVVGRVASRVASLDLALCFVFDPL